jgi:hypothetical protein
MQQSELFVLLRVVVVDWSRQMNEATANASQLLQTALTYNMCTSTAIIRVSASSN